MRSDLLLQYSPIKSWGYQKVHLRADSLYVHRVIYVHVHVLQLVSIIYQLRVDFGQPETWASQISPIIPLPCSLFRP